MYSGASLAASILGTEFQWLLNSVADCGLRGFEMLEPRRDLIRARYSPLERPGAFFLELHWPSESSLLWYGMVSLSLFDVPEGLVAEDTEHLQAQLSSGDSCAHVNLIPAITPSTAHAAPASWVGASTLRAAKIQCIC